MKGRIDGRMKGCKDRGGEKREDVSKGGMELVDGGEGPFSEGRSESRGGRSAGRRELRGDGGGGGIPGELVGGTEGVTGRGGA